MNKEQAKKYISGRSLEIMFELGEEGDADETR